MKKLLCGFVVLAAIIAGAPAIAADMPLKAPAAPSVAFASWSGLYLGLGAGLRSTETDVTVPSGTFVLGGPPQSIFSVCSVQTPPQCFSGEPFNGTAFRLSPYVGYNWQVGPQWVVGIEGDWGWADRTTTLGGMIYPASGFGFINGFSDNSFAVKTTWDASVRGRIGFLAAPSVLVYATGGAAWLHVESTSTCGTTTGICAGTGLAPAVITNSKTATGWTAGGGVEAMLWPNWVARAEYRYADFGTIHNTDTRTGPVFITSQTVNYDVEVKTHTATFGLAYKFGGGGPLAVAAVPVKAPIYKAPPAVVASWTGFYVGAAVGVRSTQTDASVTSAVLNTTGAPIDMLAICAGFPCVLSEPLDDTAFRVSPYVGYNWQFGPQWVAGIEADWGWASKTTTLVGMTYPANVLPGFTFVGFASESFAVKTTWDASVRGRLGYLAVPSVLVYATGGAAWLHAESTSTCSTQPVGGLCGTGALAAGALSPAVITNSKTKIGWTVGGGIEARLWSNWVARGEYRYANFGTISHTDVRPCVGVCGTLTNATVSYDVEVRTHTATLGLAYKFDWDRPVAAKY